MYILFLVGLLAVEGYKTYMISVDPIDLKGVEYIPAVTQVNTSLLPLYTQYTIDHGRRFHMEISNTQMVGCFLSHIAVWQIVLREQELAVVLEEDAVLPDEFERNVKEIIHSLEGKNWDIVMLIGRVWHVSTGRKVSYNDLLYACQTPRECTWYGTRGYLIHPNGAKKLLENLQPLGVQVDAYISLVNAYIPGFSLLWSKRELVYPTYFRFSKVWDGCLGCYLNETVRTLVVLGLLAAFAYSVIYGGRRRLRSGSKAPPPPLPLKALCHSEGVL